MWPFPRWWEIDGMELDLLVGQLQSFFPLSRLHLPCDLAYWHYVVHGYDTFGQPCNLAWYGNCWTLAMWLGSNWYEMNFGHVTWHTNDTTLTLTCDWYELRIKWSITWKLTWNHFRYNNKTMRLDLGTRNKMVWTYNGTWFIDHTNNSIWQQGKMATLRTNRICVIRLDRITTWMLACGIQRQQL